MTAKTSTERNKELRTRMRKRGYVYRHVWVHPLDWPRVKAFLAKINKARG